LSFFSAITQRLQQRGRRGHHAGVDLADLALHLAGVLVLDDAAHAAVGQPRTMRP
jgi:hypothetical protein